jgi:CRP/FNR family cyclic AMP-dependent transcriptional regulator
MTPSQSPGSLPRVSSSPQHLSASPATAVRDAADAPALDWSGRAAGLPAREAGARRRGHSIRLLDVEPELAAGIPENELALASLHLTVPGALVGCGPWTPPAGLDRALGCLVVSGHLVCDHRTFGVPDAQLFGEGDLFDATLLAPGACTWQGLVACELALLDARVLVSARRWPQLVSAMCRKIFDGQQQRHQLAAIRALPRVDQRLLALFWELASRWGRVCRDGIAVELPATHKLLGEIIGAQRPTVSLAIAALREEGLLLREPSGRWLLPQSDDPGDALSRTRDRFASALATR